MKSARRRPDAPGTSAARTAHPAPLAAKREESVGAWGELRLIEGIRRWLGPASPPPPYGLGDDCAVLPGSRSSQLLTVDPVILGGHFDESTPPAAVAAKLLRRNLSDLAAMGGKPTAGVLALTLDPGVSRRWLEAFYRGLARDARRFGVPIVGGDVAQATGVLIASLTLLGAAAGPRLLTRTGARRGDLLYVTGLLGRSLPTGHHLRFTPRLREGAWLSRQPEVRAMMDVSDGLAKDVHALAPRGTFPALFAETLPRRDGADVREALTDGEDYELVLALAAGTDTDAFTRRWRRAFPGTPLTRIGALVASGKRPEGALDLGRYRGYEHLQSGRSA